jgi:hypothetical protein
MVFGIDEPSWRCDGEPFEPHGRPLERLPNLVLQQYSIHFKRPLCTATDLF